MKWIEELKQLREKKTHIDRAISALERLEALSKVQRATPRCTRAKHDTASLSLIERSQPEPWLTS